MEQEERIHFAADDEEVLLADASGDEVAVLPDEVKQVLAVCRKVSLVPFPGFGEPRLVFRFEVLNPEEYKGVQLCLYARCARRWKNHPPPSSKLFKLLYIAQGGVPKGRITSKLFRGRMFRCAIGKTAGNAPYSIITEILP